MSLANPSRRGFLKAGGLLLVTVNLPAPLLALAEQGATDLPLDGSTRSSPLPRTARSPPSAATSTLVPASARHWRRLSPKSWTSRSSRSR